jgi:alpha-beta hydrolase superfamily lysophospholipase
MDPVGGFETGIKNVYENFKIKGVANITLNVYRDARHEVLNEINREEVYQDIENWLITLVPGDCSG